MRLNSYLIILYVSILAATLGPLEAESEDSSCEIILKARRNTVYNASLGEELRINCAVKFCNNPPPKVFWFKNEKNYVPVNISSSHIKTEWTQSKDFTGTSFLIFKNVLRGDSGEYQCRLADGLTVGHNINISVYDGHEPTVDTNVTQEKKTSNAEPTTAPMTSSQSLTGPRDQDTFWLFVYRVVEIMAFFIVVIIIFVITKSGCKGACCARRCGNGRLSHIYENDQ